jgi:hypothetical protein
VKWNNLIFKTTKCIKCYSIITLNIYAHFSSHFSQQLWWQRSPASYSYRYPILWKAFLDPSDSYFLFAEERGYHKWALAHSSSCLISRFLGDTDALHKKCDEKCAYTNVCSMCIKINKIGKQEIGIWWVQKRFPRYGVSIWSLWPNIRFLPSIVAEKNATKNEHICSMFQDIFRRIFLSNYRWQKSDIWSQASYRYAILWEAFLDPSDSYFLFASGGIKM